LREKRKSCKTLPSPNKRKAEKGVSGGPIKKKMGEKKNRKTEERGKKRESRNVGATCPYLVIEGNPARKVEKSDSEDDRPRQVTGKGEKKAGPTPSIRPAHTRWKAGKKK